MPGLPVPRSYDEHWEELDADLPIGGERRFLATDGSITVRRYPHGLSYDRTETLTPDQKFESDAWYARRAAESKNVDQEAMEREARYPQKHSNDEDFHEELRRLTADARRKEGDMQEIIAERVRRARERLAADRERYLQRPEAEAEDIRALDERIEKIREDRLQEYREQLARAPPPMPPPPTDMEYLQLAREWDWEGMTLEQRDGLTQMQLIDGDGVVLLTPDESNDLVAQGVINFDEIRYGVRPELIEDIW